MSKIVETFDFMAIGQAIKKAREAKDMTREQLAEILELVPRHIQSIENEGQHPNFQLFVRLITMFDISADQYIFQLSQRYPHGLHYRPDRHQPNLGFKRIKTLGDGYNCKCFFVGSCEWNPEKGSENWEI